MKSGAREGGVADGIALQGVSFRYGRREVLSGVTFELARGGSSVVTGANGVGKSTFLYLCAGLARPQSGAVLIGGHRPDPHRSTDLLDHGIRIGFVFQEGGLLSNMNAIANVALPLRYHADVLGITLADVEKRSRAALDRVGVTTDQLYELPAHLSVGVRRRVAIARAVALAPNFFFFDEPDAGQDPAMATMVLGILRELRDDPAVTLLVATSREALIDALNVDGFVLAGGKLGPRHTAPLPPTFGNRVA